MRLPLIAANWKMNNTSDTGDFPEEKYIDTVVEAISDSVEVVIFPPFTHIGLLQAIGDGAVNIGGQNISAYKNGAYTGDISADNLLAVGASYVLTGHSERRHYHNETNAVVCAKTKMALDSGLHVVVCIGETDEQNKAGETLAVLSQQIQESIPQACDMRKVVIAYEPIWAIGTGRTPLPEDVQKIHASVRAFVKEIYSGDVADSIRIVYGGSVKPDNAKTILGLADVDGALVGGASLNSTDFTDIIQSVS